MDRLPKDVAAESLRTPNHCRSPLGRPQGDDSEKLLDLLRDVDRARNGSTLVYVESVLPCPPNRVWDEVRLPALLPEVIRPLFRFAPADGPQFTDSWLERATVRGEGYLFGIIPLGVHTIFIERIDPVAREIQTRESEALVCRWDHMVHFRSAGEGRAHYSDEIIIEAGWVTLFVWLFDQWFYRHRQGQWRRIAAAKPRVAEDPAR